MATLSYESATRRQWVFVPPPRWLKRVVAVATALILPVFLVGLPPTRQSAALDYTRKIPLREAIAYSWNTDWSSVFTDSATAELVWFVPVAIVCTIMFATSRRMWLTLTTVGAAILFPFFVWGLRAPLLPLITALAFPSLFGQADGETWSEGFVALGCLGGWMILWAVVGVLLIVRRTARFVVPDDEHVQASR